jgi:glycosyl-4,4'-diaponeurosporenoate acyltransferase
VRVVHWSNTVTIVVDIVAWGVVHATTGYLVHRLPDRFFARDHFWSRPVRFEAHTRFYERVLRIKRWKDRVPEAGALFAGGVSKRSLPRRDAAGLQQFAIETRRAELGHWLAAAASPFFVLWNPPLAAALMLVYGFGVNLPFIAIQRYNRLRVERVLRRCYRGAPDRSSD